MKEVLSGGVTGILVSHTMKQVRELCNKVLWLNKGQQICFSDDVEAVTKAYEEFLITKKLPSSIEDIEDLAKKNDVRVARIQNRKKKLEQEKLFKLVETLDDASLQSLHELVEEHMQK